MVALVFAYYVFVYDPSASIYEDDDQISLNLPEECNHKVNPIDSGFLRSIPSSSGRWYERKLSGAERKQLQDTFHKVRIYRHCV